MWKPNIVNNVSLYGRKGLKAIAALLPLLGVTFLLGFFIDFHFVVGYAYVLLNSIQVRWRFNPQFYLLRMYIQGVLTVSMPQRL